MTTIKFREATLKDAVIIATNLRVADLAEVEAASGKTPEAALISSYFSSELCYVAEMSGYPFMIFGVSRFNSDMGIPWMLGTPVVTAKARHLLPVCMAFVELFNSMFPVLYNMVDKRNTQAIKVMRWLGFSVSAELPEYGVAKIPFVQFVRYNPNV